MCRPCDQDKEVTGHQYKEYVRNLRGTQLRYLRIDGRIISRGYDVLLWTGLMWLRWGLVNVLTSLVNVLTSLQINNDINTNSEKCAMQQNK